MILLLDNYDSFTYNLYQAVRSLKAQCVVVRNDKMSVKKLLALKPSGIILSPGPGRPEDAGVLLELVKKAPPTIPNKSSNWETSWGNSSSVNRCLKSKHGRGFLLPFATIWLSECTTAT